MKEQQEWLCQPEQDTDSHPVVYHGGMHTVCHSRLAQENSTAFLPLIRLRDTAPQAKAKVVVVGRIALGVPLEASPQWI